MRQLALVLGTTLIAACGTHSPSPDPVDAPARSEVLRNRAGKALNAPIKTEERKTEPEWKIRLRTALSQKCDNSFVNLAPSEIFKALQTIYSVTIVASDEIDLDTPIDLPMNNLTLAQGLEILLFKLDPDGGIVYTLKNGAIFIDDEARLGTKEKSILRFYDCRDLIGELKDFRGPELDLGSANDLGQITIEESSSETDEPITGDDLVDLIMETIEPNSWDEDAGRGITIRNGALVVNHGSDIHDQIRELLDFMRGQRALQVRTEATFWRMSRAEWLKLRDLNADSEIYLNPKQIDYLDGLRRDKPVVFDRVQCLGFNTQRMVGGGVEETVIDSTEDGMIARVGTILDVRPVIADDRKSISSALRITRARVMRDKSDKPTLSQQFYRGQISLPNSGQAVVSVGQDGTAITLIIVSQELQVLKRN